MHSKNNKDLGGLRGGALKAGFSLALWVVFHASAARADDFVTIGYTNNAADTGGYGAVAYTYNISKYEVTIAQMQASGAGSGDENFWNTGGRTLGTNAPAVNVTFYEAMKYCNWLTSGNTDIGYYSTSDGGATYQANALSRDAYAAANGRTYFVPTEDEWYKAAYFKPDGYSLLANGGGTLTKSSDGLTGWNYDNALSPSQPWTVDKGTEEQNGTFNMMGNVTEFMVTTTNTIVYRGGRYNNATTYAQSSRRGIIADSSAYYIGFRVVKIDPETSLTFFLLSVPTTGGSFETRRQLFLDAVWKDFQKGPIPPSANYAFWRAGALFELGKIEEGRVLVTRGLDLLVPGNVENRWIYGGNTGVYAWPGLDCYIRYEKYLDEQTKARYKEIYTGGAFYQRLSTSNHKIMAATSRYLATQIWGPEAFYPAPFYLTESVQSNYPSPLTPEKAMCFEETDPTGEQYVRAMIKEMVESGPAEYASRPYGAQNILPILSIAECSTDAELSKQAALAYECALIQLAPAYLRGNLATFAPRSYPDVETQSPRGVASLLWPYFGGVMPKSLDREWALRVATASHRLPAVVEKAGTDRSQPYVYRAKLARWALTHFVNKDYVLFSRSPKAGEKQFSGQSYPCGVMWDEPDTTKGSHLWITNPAADEPGKMGIHTHGVTQFEQELLHRDALLFVFNIPADFRHPYILGYVPGGFRATLTATNRIFLHYGSVLISICSTAPIDWDPQAGIYAPAATPNPGDSEFRVMATKAALAIETALPEEFPGATAEQQLASFRDRLLSRSQIQVSSEGKPVGRYTDRSGNTLECAFDGEDKINGTVVDYDQWPVLESPWTEQLVPDGPMEVSDGSATRLYDFKNWTAVDGFVTP